MSSNNAGGGGGGGMHFSGKERQKDTRIANIVAATAVADAVRTSLGPKGMDKMITSSTGETIITNDGATILKKMELQHPVAQMMVELSKAQDVEAGDGTTSVVVIAGALLNAAKELLDKGIHPTQISDAWLKAAEQCFTILKAMAVPADLGNKEALIKAAVTSLNSKVVSSNAALLAPMAVEAVLRIIDVKTATNLDLDDIKVVKKIGGTVEDTELIDGIIFDKGASHAAGGPTSITKAKIGLIQYCLSAPKTNMDNTIVIDDYQQIDRLIKGEREYVLKILKPIVKSGCNVLLIQKSILRDALNDISLHFLAKYKIMVVKDVERTDIEFISQTLGCTPVADWNNFTSAKLGQAESVEEVDTPGGRVVKVTGITGMKGEGKTVSILCRGSNRLMVDEAERSLHDALCVVRSLVKHRFMLPGGGAPETEMTLQLEEYANKLGGTAGYCISGFARALEVIPYTLSENAGLNPVKMVTELKRRHAKGEKTAGINVKKGGVFDILEDNVLQPLLVSLSAIKLATECVRTILKIDEIVAVR